MSSNAMTETTKKADTRSDSVSSQGFLVSEYFGLEGLSMATFFLRNE